MPDLKNKYKEAKRWGPALIWAVLILFLSLMPLQGLSGPDIPFLDKIIHFLEYLVFAILLMRVRYGLSSGKTLLFTLIISVLYGILMELCQSFVPGRYPSFGDTVMNILGALSGITIGKVIICRE